MHSEKSKDIQDKRSFIEEARRAQIIEAAIAVLSEVGYAKASLAKIAAKAGISTSLTLYHFKDRRALMLEVMGTIDHAWMTYINEKLHSATTARERLRVYIEASLAFMGTRPQHFAAMIELTFNGRDLYGGYEAFANEEDPSLLRIRQILEEGQQNGEFMNFDSTMMALMIRGAIDQFLGYVTMQYSFDLETYTNHVITTFERVIVKEK
ncbi:MAG TPA: TetR family transcriptional regulator [Candidatus Saccharimonadales bacterium]|nr:TetR family transcriptional regulator [Candidatus Saccharimonadales bacterium]